MGRRKKGDKIDGWINFNKPLGMTSTQAVGMIRRALNAQKIGHGGTLDPLASGVLPIALGEATKTISYIQDALKTYYFTVTWGEQRSTDDAEGEVIQSSDKRPSQDEIQKILPRYTGDIEQIPPQFSALKVEGHRAYDLARAGEEIEIKPRHAFVDTFEIQDHSPNETRFICTCGKGTYIRAFARDFGKDLGCFGYISALKRQKVGVFNLEHAFSLDFFQKMIDNPCTRTREALLPVQSVLDDIPALPLKPDEAASLKQGRSLCFISKSDFSRLQENGIDLNAETAIALLDNTMIAMVTIDGPNIQPIRVFNI